MMQNMRDKTQGLIAGVIAVLIALTFVLWGVQNYLRTGASQVVAKVNGTEITQQELRIAYEQAKRTDRLRTGHAPILDQNAQAKLKQDVLQSLIRQQVILQAAEEMGLGLGRNQMWSVIFGMPAFQVDGKFSAARFQQLISNVYASEQAFFDALQNSFVESQLERAISESSFLLPYEIELMEKISKQRRNFGYFTVPFGRFTKSISVTPEEVQKYYDEYQNEFLLPEKISIQYLELSSDDLQSKIKPTDEQLEQFYHGHKDLFSTPKKWQVTRVLMPLSDGSDEKTVEKAKETLEAIAKQGEGKKDLTSSDPKAQITTSWLKRSDLSPEIAGQLDKLEVDQVSAPMRIKGGYILFKPLAIQPSETKPYAKVTDEVKKLYNRQELAQAFSDISDRLADLVYINSDSLEPASRDLGLKLKETELFARDTAKTGVLANQKIVSSAFSDVVLKQRYNSSLIELGAGKIIVLRIKEHIPERVKPLKEVQDGIKQTLQYKKSQKNAAKLADELLDDLKNDKSEADLAKKYDLTWSTKQNVSYGESTADAKLVDAAFDLPKPESKDSSLSVVELNGSYLVLRLDKVYYVADDKESARIDGIVKILPRMLGQFDYQFLMQNLESKAKIKNVSETEAK